MKKKVKKQKQFGVDMNFNYQNLDSTNNLLKQETTKTISYSPLKRDLERSSGAYTSPKKEFTIIKKQPSDKIKDLNLEKVELAYQTTKILSLLYVLDSQTARKWCINTGGSFTKFVVNSVAGTTFGYVFGGITGAYLAYWLMPYYPKLTTQAAKETGNIAGGIVGFALGTYCWQATVFENTYREWRQQNLNTEVLAEFDEFLNTDEELSKYIDPIKKKFCVCPIKIERKITKDTKETKETVYFSGFDLGDPDYVKAIEKYLGRNLSDTDIALDINTYASINIRIEKLLQYHESHVKNDVEDPEKRKIINSRSKNRFARHSSITVGKL